jgi:pseudolysin
MHFRHKEKWQSQVHNAYQEFLEMIMVQHRNCLWFSLSIGLFFSTQNFAAEPIALYHTPFSEIKQLFAPQIPGLTMIGKPRANELHFIGQHIDQKHITHVRMQQYYSGFPVFGGYAIMHGAGSARTIWTTKNEPAAMNGTVFNGLSADLGKPDADFVATGTEALERFKSNFSGQKLMDGSVQPMVYIDGNHQAHWAYKVSVVVIHGDKIPEHPTAIVDFKSFETYAQWNDVKTARALVNGRGYGGNRLIGIHQYGGDLPLLSITRSDVTGLCYMENPHVKVVNMMHHYQAGNRSMHFVCSDDKRQSDGSYMTGYKGDGYDRVNGAYSPSNDAMYAGAVIYDMYKKWYGVYPLEESGHPKKLLMRVHFGTRYDNAFWDGEQMTFGDGGFSFYPLVSLGVGAHEISHGFTEQHANLVYFGQSGGMNESFSDMAAQTAEFYSTGHNTWTIGAEIVKESSGMKAFRFMDKPSRDGISIDDANQYTEGMDVHHSSGVYNRLFYLLSTTPGWNVRKAFEVMLTANADYWTPTSSFDEGACGVLDATKSFDYSLEDVKNVMSQVGVHYSECYDDTNEQEGGSPSSDSDDSDEPDDLDE